MICLTWNKVSRMDNQNIIGVWNIMLLRHVTKRKVMLGYIDKTGGAPRGIPTKRDAGGLQEGDEGAGPSEHRGLGESLVGEIRRSLGYRSKVDLMPRNATDEGVPCAVAVSFPLLSARRVKEAAGYCHYGQGKVFARSIWDGWCLWRWRQGQGIAAQPNGASFTNVSIVLSVIFLHHLQGNGDLRRRVKRGHCAINLAVYPCPGPWKYRT